MLLTKDRVKELVSSTGTTTLSLSGAETGFQAFSVLGNNTSCNYTIVDVNSTAWEVGRGVYNSNTLTRDVVFESSSAGSKINLSATGSTVFLTYPGSKAAYNDIGLNRDYTASGSITAGKPLILNADNTVSQVIETGNTVVEGTGINQPAQSGSYFDGMSSLTWVDESNGIFALGYLATNGYPTAIIGTVDGANKTITYGSAFGLSTSYTNTKSPSIAYDPDQSKLFMTFNNNSDSLAYGRFLSVSGTTISSAGVLTVMDSDQSTYQKIMYDTVNNVMLYLNINSTSTNLEWCGVTMTGTTPSRNSSTQQSLSTSSIFMKNGLSYDSVNGIFYTALNVSNNDNIMQAGKWNGSQFIIGTASAITTPTNDYNNESTTWYGTDYKFAQFYTTSNEIYGTIVTVDSSNLSVTNSTPQLILASMNGTFAVSYDSTSGKISLLGRSTNSSSVTAVITISSTTFSTTTPVEFLSANSQRVTSLPTSDISQSENPTVFSFQNGTSSIAESRVFTQAQSPVSNLESNNYFGVASSTASTTEPVGVNRAGSFNNDQTGMTAGKDMYVTDAGLIKERTTTTVTPNTNPTFARGNITTSSNTSTGSIAYEATSGRHVYAYKDTGNSGYNTVVAGVWSNGAMTWGTATVVASAGSGTDNGSAICAGNGAIYIIYKQGNYTKMYARAATISGTTFTFGTAVDFSSGGSAHLEAAIGFDESTNYIIACYSYDDGGSKTYLRPLTASGTALTVGSSQYPIYNSNAAAIRTNLIYDPDTSRTVFTYCDSADGDKGKSIVLQSTGSTGSPTLTVGSAVTWASQGTGANSVIYDTANNKMFVSSYKQESGVDYWKGCIGTVTGGSTNTISWTAQSIVWQPSGGNASTFASTYDSSVNKGYIWFRENSVMKYNTIAIGTSSFTMGTAATLPNSTDQIVWNCHGAVYNSANGTLLGGRQTGGSTNYSQWLSAFTGTTTTLTINGSQFVGTARSGTDLELSEPPTELVGYSESAITKGRAVVVKPDGNYAQAGLTTTSVTNTGTASQGSLGNIGTYSSDMFAMAVASDGVTYCFTYQNTSTQQACKIGTRSGETISWGSELVLASVNSDSHFVSYNEEANVFLTTYTTGNTVKGTAVSFSGNTGTKGSEVTIMDLGNTSSSPSYHYQHWYDSTNKVSVCWAKGGVSGNQTNRSSAVALTITGTSISVGTLYENASAGGSKQKGCDVTGGKHVLYWNNNSGYPSTMTMTVTSSGAISWGTTLVINSASSSFANPIYNLNYPNKVIIAGVLINSTYSYAGFNISGTSISTANFNTGGINNANSYTESGGNMGVYSNYSGNYCFVYQTYSPYNSRYNFATTTDGLTLTVATAVTTTAHGSSQFYAGACASDVDGVVVENHNDRSLSPGYYSYYCFNPTFSFTSTTQAPNMTSANVIGIAQETILANNDIKVKTFGQVDENQSSLTTGSAYFVNGTTGAIQTTADDPSVNIGTALNSTNLLIKS